MPLSQQPQRSRIILAFALLYVLWGSTYLAMRVIVRDLPPYVAGAARYLLAGPIMLAVLALTGRKVRLSLQDFRRLLVISILLLSIGNIGVLWGEEYVSSGLASLMVALVPIWVVIIEAWFFRAGRMTAKGIFGLALGIVGLLVLLWPRIASGSHLGGWNCLGSAILATGSFFWALGSVFSHRYDLSVDVFVSAAWQMALGGLVNGIIALVFGQFPKTHWTAHALEGHWLSCRLRLLDRLLSLHLSAGARADTEGGDICVCQSDCRGLSGLDHSARACRRFHAAGDRNHYRVSGAGEYVKIEACTS